MSSTSNDRETVHECNYCHGDILEEEASLTHVGGAIIAAFCPGHRTLYNQNKARLKIKRLKLLKNIAISAGCGSVGWIIQYVIMS